MRRKPKKTVVAPVPVGRDGRNCFRVEWYASEEDAAAAAKIARDGDETYNGGFFHGMPCGRAKEFDRVFDGRKQYAVTRR